MQIVSTEASNFATAINYFIELQNFFSILKFFVQN